MTVTDTEILERIRAIFKENFAIEPERVTPEAHLFEELDLDSIDAVDLAIKLQEMTGRRIKPEEFKSVRTVGDVIAAESRCSRRRADARATFARAGRLGRESGAGRNASRNASGRAGNERRRAPA